MKQLTYEQAIRLLTGALLESFTAGLTLSEIHEHVDYIGKLLALTDELREDLCNQLADT